MITRRYTEAEASLVVSVLEEAGIKSIATGGFTAGFRAEAPGVVTVQVFESDREAAAKVIAELDAELETSLADSDDDSD
ncbi:MAG: DUF2007 domain-containing protein [Planctomycetota bacterium]